MNDTANAIERAAHAIREAGALAITAGAGMSVDSGLPDFRGDEGFWKAYPAYRELGLSFIEMANPGWFESAPHLAWGFYGHRRDLYHSASPHRGFEILRRWSERCAAGYFVFTSNVDGHFQKAGFDPQRIIECHGSIEFEQCSVNCGEGVWSAPLGPVMVDESTMRAEGTLVPTVRSFSERLGEAGTLIRINMHELDLPPGQIGIELGALEALEQIDRVLRTVEEGGLIPRRVAGSINWREEAWNFDP